MLFKSSSVLPLSSSALKPARYHLGAKASPCSWQRHHPIDRSRCRNWCMQTRNYASAPPPCGDATNKTPHQWPTSPNPTPYEILGLARGVPYNKRLFYQLAMLYHPDRHLHTSHDGLPHLTKLERYRLVVAANDLLSDPQRRRMYDMHGYGWESEAATHERHRDMERAWRRQPGNASMNATWEDWERWYQERDGKQRDPLYTSNGLFASLVVMFLFVAGWAQVTRAGTNSINLLDMRERQHAAISQEMRQREGKTAGLGREDRVHSFLRQRELERWGHDPPGHDRSPSGSTVDVLPALPLK